MTEWKNVKDALPTEIGKIIVIINEEILLGEAVENVGLCCVDKKVYFEIKYVYENTKIGYILYKKPLGGRWIKNPLYAEVSHWMPLPEIPT